LTSGAFSSTIVKTANPHRNGLTATLPRRIYRHFLPASAGKFVIFSDAIALLFHSPEIGSIITNRNENEREKIISGAIGCS